MHRRKLSDSSSDEKHKRKNKFHYNYSGSKKLVSNSMDPYRNAGYEGAYGHTKGSHIKNQYSNQHYQAYGSSYNSAKNKHHGQGLKYYDDSSSSSDYYKVQNRYNDLSYTKSYKNYDANRRFGNGRYEDMSYSAFPSYQGYDAYSYQTPYPVGQQRYIGGINPSHPVDVQGIRKDIEASYNVLPPRQRYDPGLAYRPIDTSISYAPVHVRQDYLSRPVTGAEVRVTSNENYLNSSAAPLYGYREYEALARPNYSAFSTRWQPTSQSVVYNNSVPYDDIARRSRYQAGYDRYYAAGANSYESELDFMERKYRTVLPPREGILRQSYGYAPRRVLYGPEHYYY